MTSPTLPPRSARNDPFLDLYSFARPGPSHRDRFTPAQVEHIRRTVRRVPEVMVKVTGGGRTKAAVRAHLSYIAHEGEAPIENDRGEPVTQADQRSLVAEWNLELSSGQYRPEDGSASRSRPIKLVHNIVLSMPSPTPAHKVRAAAHHFAREHFWGQHRYAMALHTHQQHPHVHLVVKAEREDGQGRLRIDKAMLRQWREDFAQAMREEGVAANATPRAVRGQNKRSPRAAVYWSERRGASNLLDRTVRSIVAELKSTRTFRDPAHAKLEETRKAITAGWQSVARILDAQGEIELAGDVHYFLSQMPRVLTDREKLAIDFIAFLKQGPPSPSKEERVQERRLERTR